MSIMAVIVGLVLVELAAFVVALCRMASLESRDAEREAEWLNRGAREAMQSECQGRDRS